jgi:hypothetical protein
MYTKFLNLFHKDALCIHIATLGRKSLFKGPNDFFE